MLRHVFRHGGVVIPQVNEVHLGKRLGQEGRQGIGVGVPDQQDLAAVLISNGFVR